MSYAEKVTTYPRTSQNDFADLDQESLAPE